MIAQAFSFVKKAFFSTAAREKSVAFARTGQILSQNTAKPILPFRPFQKIFRGAQVKYTSSSAGAMVSSTFWA